MKQNLLFSKIVPMRAPQLLGGPALTPGRPVQE